MKRRNKGFTLIELLMVIAIIGVLIGFLAPSVAKATQRAKMAGDLNSLKQVGLAMQMYADDHSGKSPSAISDLVGSYLDDPNVVACSNGTPFTTWQGTPTSLLPGVMAGAPSENILAFASQEGGEKPPAEITLDDADMESYPPFVLVLRGDFVAEAMSEDEFARIGFTLPPGGPEESADGK